MKYLLLKSLTEADEPRWFLISQSEMAARIEVKIKIPDYPGFLDSHAEKKTPRISVAPSIAQAIILVPLKPVPAYVYGTDATATVDPRTMGANPIDLKITGERWIMRATQFSLVERMVATQVKTIIGFQKQLIPAGSTPSITTLENYLERVEEFLSTGPKKNSMEVQDFVNKKPVQLLGKLVGF